ncbi:MAG: adenylyltransferase/cytidyltransferase family protein [Nitrososphaerales archaeon]|jgi:cytidyltransferase-like protein
MKENELLRAVYSTRLRGGTATAQSLAQALRWTSEEVARGLDEVSRDGLVEIAGEDVSLTATGRGRLTVVMIGGAFEIIHPGHIHTIEGAKKLGDTLVVVLAADPTVTKNKGREPVTPQEWRVRLVSALRDVDVALPGGKGSIYDTMERIRPDVVALGYDQKHNPQDIEGEAKRRGLELRVVRLDSPIPGVKTSKIVSSL